MPGRNALSLFPRGVGTGNDTQMAVLASKQADFATLPDRAYTEHFSMEPLEIEKLIEAGLPDAEVQVVSDDNTHFAARVVSEVFAGKRLLARHQMVYQCLGPLMGREIHAMSIRAHTPGEWAELRQTGSG
jgi:acid stress-induced BolA-like protein IbaG/YrbA